MRKQILEKRNNLEEESISFLSDQIQKFVIESKEFQSARVVGAYYPFGSEVRTNKIIEESKVLGKIIALPSVEGEILTFYNLSSARYLVKGRFGIMEPLPYDPMEKIDLLVVPGIAFDNRGYRLGYGKGYYDKFLAQKKIFSVGLAYSFQLLELLPDARHDVRLDAIASETGIRYT